MKTLNLRQAIIQRIQDKQSEQLIEVIDGSIGSDEKALPGLGVIFEKIWQHIDDPQKIVLATALNEALANEPRI